jgi:hypothetical protein
LDFSKKKWDFICKNMWIVESILIKWNVLFARKSLLGWFRLRYLLEEGFIMVGCGLNSVKLRG